MKIATLVNKLCNSQGIPNRNGGVLALMMVRKTDRESWYTSLSVGSCPEEKWGGYMRNAPEKIGRLKRRRLDGIRDVAASQSADSKSKDERLWTYGGGLFFEDAEYEYYFSFSGAPPMIDEVAMLMLGEESGWACPLGYINEHAELARAICKEL